jgi:exodeoxyribonuclease-3
MKLKIMTYNTLYGGYDGNDNKRYKLLTAVITSEDPDILLLQELKQFTQDGSQRYYQLEKDVGLRGFLAPALNTALNTAIFIRNNIMQPLSFETDSVHFHHATAILKVKIKEVEKPLTVICVHLCPFSAQIRLNEVAYLFNYAAAHDYTIMAGDFNAVSPLDEEPVGIWELKEHHLVRYLGTHSQKVDHAVLSKLYAAGYIDVAHLLQKNNEATVPVLGFKNNTEFMSFRSDYILCTKALSGAFKRYDVIKNENTDFASDHYPLVAELELP